MGGAVVSEFTFAWLVAVVAGVLIIFAGFGLERLRPAQHQVFSDTLLNAKYLFPFHAARILIVPVSVTVMAPAIAVLGGGWIALPSTGVGLIVGVAAYILAMDLGEYWFHRAQHKIPFLWALHSLHHSDDRLNISTTHRHFWGDLVLKGITIYPLILILLKPNPAALGAYAVAGYYNVFLHANVRIGGGRWSWLINTPQYHRLHHSNRPEDCGLRFAAIFPVWDLLFGSYRAPQSNDYPPIGTIDGRKPTNLLQAVLWPGVK